MLQSVSFVKGARLEGHSCRNCGGAGQSAAVSAWTAVGGHGWGTQQGGRLFPERPKSVLGDHATSARTRMEEFYTPELLRKVHLIYAEDYQQFGTHCGWAERR